MRILKKRARYVWRNIQLTKSRLLLFFILLLLGFLLFVMNIFPYASIGTALILLSYFLGMYSYQKYLTWKSGEFSSDLVIKKLEELPDSYALISGAVIPPSRGDTDHIIIGPNGIFVVETKHYGGEIRCDGDKWERYKIGKKGNKYMLWAGSPSNQVKRNAKVLKDLLLEHKEEIFERTAPHIWIESAILFTNERANLQITKPTVQILDIDEISDFILSMDSKYSLSEQEIERISALIIQYSK